MSPWISTVVIAVGTLSLVGLSWRSLLRPRSHGFFRFFAFEAILCLVVLNLPRWFHRPAAPLQIVSWVLLIASLFVGAHGIYLLRQLGRPTRPPAESPDFRFEHTSNLVTVGVYRYIRHPLYASLLYLTWGAALKDLSAGTVTLALAATVFLVATAKAEETENLVRFGDAYREYMARTRLFIPFVF